MHNERTNLLPPERRRALRRDYFFRLSIVTALLLIALTLISATLLLPTYVFLSASIRAKEQHLASIESALSSADQTAISAQLATLLQEATALTTLADAPSATETVRAVLALPRPGISLSGFAYAFDTKKNLKTLSISGSSMTRNSLRNYQLALQAAPFAKSADLPVSSYAQDTNIAFTITVTLVP